MMPYPLFNRVGLNTPVVCFVVEIGSERSPSAYSKSSTGILPVHGRSENRLEARSTIMGARRSPATLKHIGTRHEEVYSEKGDNR